MLAIYGKRLKSTFFLAGLQSANEKSAVLEITNSRIHLRIVADFEIGSCVIAQCRAQQLCLELALDEFAIGAELPEFSLPSVSGEQIGSAYLGGAKAGLVVFLCNHCPYVKGSEEMLIRIFKEFAPKGLRAVTISSNDASQYPEDSFAKMNLKCLFFTGKKCGHNSETMFFTQKKYRLLIPSNLKFL